MITRSLIGIVLVLCLHHVGAAQVPFDLSKAVVAKTVMNVRIGGEVTYPRFIRNACGKTNFNLITVGSSTGGRQFFSSPRIDTNTPTNKGWGSTYMPIDYDGIPPLEYMNANGRIDGCLDSNDPFVHTKLDTVSCWTLMVNPNYSLDVDGDGYLDIVCDLLGGGVLAHVILGGPNAGKGCKRVAVINGHRHNDTSIARKFFRSSSGRWRLVQWERGRSDLSPRMFLYDVGLKRVGNNFETTFTPLDSLYGGSSSLNDDPFYTVEELVDTVHHKDYVLIQHVVDFDPRTWALERFDITEGTLKSTGEIVTGYSFFDNQNLGHSLGTDVPVIGITSYRGICYCYANDITRPFAVLNPVTLGIQTGAGFAVINDQTGDGKPDIVLTGGSSDGRMAVITFDQSVGVDENPTEAPTISTASIVGDQLDVTLVAPDVISVDVATTSGQQWTAVPPTPADAGTLHYDIATLLHNRPSGAYFLRVHLGTRVVSIPVTR